MNALPARILTLALCLAGAASTTANGQCLLANPSFEVGAGADGWNTFGDVIVNGWMRAHGSRVASVAGPFTGDWGVSGVWQPRPAGPGARFDATVRVAHPSADPLTGDARALLNIEWRDAADQLISYESHTILTPSDPTDRFFARAIASGPAPAGTASVRLLLGVLQSPALESGRAVFDLATLTERTTPSYDEIQWNDFPGGRIVQFGGYPWRVKGPGFFGPGPNWFADGPANVEVDGGELTLAIRGAPGAWSSAEVTLEDPLGYGDHVFTSRGRLDTLAPNVVLGLFLWQYPRCELPGNVWNQHNEADVEISRWGNPMGDTAQFVVQPWDAPGNIVRFDIDYTADELVSYAFRWLPGRLEYRVWRGGPAEESPATTIATWTYTGPHLPRPEQPRVHLNLWWAGADGPTDGLEQTAVLNDFVFRPMSDVDLSGRADFLDVAAFLRGLDAQDPAADLDNDGFWTVRDLDLLLEDLATR